MLRVRVGWGLLPSAYLQAAAAVEGVASRYLELRIVRHGDVSKPKYLDSQIYKRRLAAVLAPWLVDSNRRALDAGTTAFCCTTGLGLGAWGVDSRQRDLMNEVYAELLTTLPLPAISDLVACEPKELGALPCPYSTRPPNSRTQLRCLVPAGVIAGDWFSDASTGNAIRIRPAKLNGSWRDPAIKLRGADDGKLLCAMYAWDGGAYPGNEFYEPYGMLSGSGDPAAACCSTITEVGNPEINTAVCGANTILCSTDGTCRKVGTGVLLPQSALPPASAGKAAPKTLRRSPSAEGLHRLLERDGLSADQRKLLLRRLGQRQRAVEGLDALLQHSDAGLEIGRLLAERDALTALADPSAPVDSRVRHHFMEELVASASVTEDNIRACAADVDELVGQLLVTQPAVRKMKPPRCPQPPLGMPPPPPPPQLADQSAQDDVGAGDKHTHALDLRTKMALEIEQLPLKKKLEAGIATEEEQVRLEEIETTLQPPARTSGVAILGDARGATMAVITARRVD